MTPPKQVRGFMFALHEGVDLRLPPTELSLDDRIVLVASIARALNLPLIDEVIRQLYTFSFADDSVRLEPKARDNDAA